MQAACILVEGSPAENWRCLSPNSRPHWQDPDLSLPEHFNQIKKKKISICWLLVQKARWAGTCREES